MPDTDKMEPTAEYPGNMTFPIVGIGASAGGMKALEAFLSALPTEFRCALIFIQHLSPTHKSLLPGLLKNRMPGLDITEIADRMRIRTGRLYICPPGVEVRLGEGFFRVAPGPKGHNHYPIDEFFESLAAEAQENSVAVVLSGAGTDGARGISAVRSAGGCVYVQEPETAEFPGMPLAAISTGVADGILSPEGIAAEILKLLETDETFVQPAGLLAPEEYEAFYHLIHQKTGQRFVHYKKTVVSRRIRRRMYLGGIKAVREYLDLVANREGEAEALARDLMIGVTSFYRDRVAWRALKLDVVRRLAEEESSGPLRVWTPACATGEEPYSITMLLLNELGRLNPGREILVFATDVNETALDRAREGKYPASVAADVPQEFLQKYFVLSADGQSIVVAKDVRERVVFARQDLLTDPPFSRLDLVICRNLMIYLEPEAQDRCISLFHYALRPGGYLFLGNAESAGRSLDLFTPVGHKKCRIYRKEESSAAKRPPASVPFAVERAQSALARQVMAVEERHSGIRLIQDALIEEYAPAAVGIDRSYDIVYHNGPTNRYLRHPRGVPTRNLLELLPDSMASRLRSAIYRTAVEGRPVSVRAALPGDERKKRQVTLRISKLGDDLFLVVFREKSGPREEAVMVAAEPHDAAGEEAVRQLEAELAASRADLQSHIEQLKSLNEELQSSNEELQAANEEQETSREELQSLNEELITVNSQLQEKIMEQEELNNDLTNFLTSTSIPTVFLDHQFRVRRFTPAMSKLIQLIPSDVGRPIMDLSQDNLGPDLTDDARAVLDLLAPIRKEVYILSTWYVRVVLPYRTSDNRIEGVVVTYNNINDLKLAEECSVRLASFPQLNPNPVIEVDCSGRVIFSNAASHKVLESRGLDMGNIKPLLPEDLDDIVAAWDKKTESAIHREIVVKDRVFDETIQLVPQFEVARIYALDITERKRAEEAKLRAKEEWELTFDSVPDLIAILDNEHRIQRVNKAMAQRLGKTPEECIGLRCHEYVHGTSVPPSFCPHSRTIEDGCEHFAEVREDLLGGDFVVSTTPLFDAQGGRHGSVHVAHDITGRKRAEEALRESERQVRRKLESILAPEEDLGSLDLADIIDAGAIQSLMEDFYRVAPIPMAVIDLKGKVLVGVGWQDICVKFHRVHPETRKYCIESDTQLSAAVPPGSFKLYKCKNNMWDVVTPITIGGKHIGNLFTGQFFFEDEPLDHEFFRSQAREYGFSEEEYIAALEAVPRLNRETLNNSMAFFLKFSDMISQLSYSNIKLARSVAERDGLMESLQNSLSSFALLAMTAGELLQSTEPQKVVESVCRKVMEFLDCHVFLNFLVDEQTGGLHLSASAGIPQEEAMRIERLVYDTEVCGGVARDGLPIVAEHIPSTQDERTELVKSYGTRAYACYPLIGPGGKVIGTLYFGTSSRETFRQEDLALMNAVADQVAVAMMRMRGEYSLRQRTSELEEVNRELESFIYSISHDLRAPLRSIAGFIRIVVEDYAGLLDAQGQGYLARIHASAEKMSRLIEDLLYLSKISRQEIERGRIDLSGLASSVVAELRESDPARKVEADIQEGLRGYADLRLIKIVLSNLLGNAWKFTSKTDNARIEFGVLEKGDTVYYVRDNGAGFDQAYADKMFWPFHRLHSDSEFEGSGIGLAIVERVIRRHGGRMWAEGDVGKGATVYFTLK